ncbi:thioredoxin family protein [Paenibacillus yanchengensis]|uniref:Thioredoxin family protein n=1 Tax=Paenibacillus yanchengensis TaxID=2035833 RepID=A0ABW4YNN3_9BACL
MKKKSNSKMIYLYLGIIVVLIAGIFAFTKLEPKNSLYDMPTSKLNPATRDQLKDSNYQNIILPAALDKKITDKEDFFVYYFSPTCGYCQLTTPELMPLAKELSVPIHQLNVLEFRNYQSKMSIEHTPTLVYYEDGVEVERMEGGIKTPEAPTGHPLDDYKQFLTKHHGSN